jgi:hypothetical protein
MAEAIFRGIVKAGRFCPDDIVKHRAWLARVEGRRVVETIKREQQSRTMSQNRYYWGVVLATLAEWSGHTAEELHGFLRDEFLTPREKKLPSGQSISYPVSTTTLTVHEFTAYIDQVMRWAAEQGVYIPEASEVAP